MGKESFTYNELSQIYFALLSYMEECQYECDNCKDDGIKSTISGSIKELGSLSDKVLKMREELGKTMNNNTNI